jgi:hypothetical protein
VKRSTEDDIGTPVKNGDFGDHLSQQQKSKNDKISFTFFAKNGSPKIFCDMTQQVLLYLKALMQCLKAFSLRVIYLL